MKYRFSALLAVAAWITTSHWAQVASAQLTPLKESPPLNTAEDRVRALVQIKTLFPQLFKRKVDYDAKFLNLVEDQNRLAHQLEGIPGITETFSNLRSRPYLQLEVTPTLEKPQFITRMIPAALAEWKNSFRAGLDQLERNHAPATKITQALQTELTKLEAILQPQSPASALIVLLNQLSGATEKLKPLPDKYRDESSEKKLEVLEGRAKEGSLPEKLGDLSKVIEKSDLEKLGFQKAKAYSGQELLQLLVQNRLLLLEREAAEASFTSELALAAVLLSGDQLETQTQTVSQAQSWIDELGEHSVQLLVNKDTLTGRLKTLSSYKGVGSMIDAIWKQIKVLSQKTERVQSNLKRGLVLQEVPPLIGILRGMAGGDCSTRYSFPFPNHPAEKVFLVKDGETDFIKGYVSTRTVTQPKSADRRTLYIHTIQGAYLNDSNILNILQALYSARDEFGVEDVALPESALLGAIVNYSNITAFLDPIVRGGKTVEIQYLIPEVSQAIETFESQNNRQNFTYDHRQRNQNAVIVGPFDLSGTNGANSVTVQRSYPVYALSSEALARDQLLDFIIDLYQNNRSDQMEPYFKVAGISDADWSHFVETSRNSDKARVAAFLDKITQASVQFSGVPDFFLTTRPDVILLGYLNAPDAFSVENLPMTSKFLADLIASGAELTEVNRFLVRYAELLLPRDPALLKKLPHLKALEKLANSKSDDSLVRLNRLLSGTGRNPFTGLLLERISGNQVESERLVDVMRAAQDDSASAQREALEALLACRNASPLIDDKRAQACQVFQDHPGFLGKAALALYARQTGGIFQMARVILSSTFELPLESKDLSIALPQNTELDAAIADFYQALIETKDKGLSSERTEIVRKILALQSEKSLVSLAQSLSMDLPLDKWQLVTHALTTEFSNARVLFFKGLIEKVKEDKKSPSSFKIRKLVAQSFVDLFEKIPADAFIAGKPSADELFKDITSLLDSAWHLLKDHDDFYPYSGLSGILGFRRNSEENITLNRDFRLLLSAAIRRAFDSRNWEDKLLRNTVGAFLNDLTHRGERTDEKSLIALETLNRVIDTSSLENMRITKILPVYFSQNINNRNVRSLRLKGSRPTTQYAPPADAVLQELELFYSGIFSHPPGANVVLVRQDLLRIALKTLKSIFENPTEESFEVALRPYADIIRAALEEPAGLNEEEKSDWSNLVFDPALRLFRDNFIKGTYELEQTAHRLVLAHMNKVVFHRQGGEQVGPLSAEQEAKVFQGTPIRSPELYRFYSSLLRRVTHMTLLPEAFPKTEKGFDWTAPFSERSSHAAHGEDPRSVKERVLLLETTLQTLLKTPTLYSEDWGQHRAAADLVRDSLTYAFEGGHRLYALENAPRRQVCAVLSGLSEAEAASAVEKSAFFRGILEEKLLEKYCGGK